MSRNSMLEISAISENFQTKGTRTHNHLARKQTLNQFGQMVECSFKVVVGWLESLVSMMQ